MGVRFGAHFGLNSNIAQGPKRAKLRTHAPQQREKVLEKPDARFLRDLGIWRTSGQLSERNILRIASTLGQLRRSGRGPMRYRRQDRRDQNLGKRRSC
jgi:hypothetical protein